MIFRQLFHQETCTYTYLLADELSREAVLIDPVIESIKRDLRLLDELGLKLIYSLDTHVHADHITASGMLRERTGARSGVSAQAGVACADQQLAHGDRLAFGRYELEVRSTPGHTAGCVTYVLDEGSKVMAFTGDALFVRGCGRTDFQQGDAATLYRSVHDQIYSLPADAVIYPGHDYKGHTSSTVAEEWQHNPRLNRKVDRATFVELMDELVHQLDERGSIDLSVQARVVLPLLSDRAGGVPLVVMPRIDHGVCREAVDLIVNRAIQGGGVALLKVRAPATAHKERIAGKRHHLGTLIEDIGHATRRVPRGAAHLELVATKGEPIPMSELLISTGDARLRRDAAASPCSLSQHTGRRDVIGVDVRVEAVDELEPELIEQPQVTLDRLDDRVDKDSLSTELVGQQVGVGAGLLMKELSKDHDASSYSLWKKMAALSRLEPPFTKRVRTARKLRTRRSLKRLTKGAFDASLNGGGDLERCRRARVERCLKTVAFGCAV